jgi:glycosyltransferase involved in cell wall biosynthesis
MDARKKDRMRIAFFTPLSPLQTAIADHSEGLLPHLARQAEIDLFIDDGYRPTNLQIVEQFNIYSYRDFARRAGEYDALLYAMGNHADYHGYVYEMMQHHPGVTILHDTTLHHCMLGLTLGRGNVEQYVEEMTYAYGEAGAHAAYQVVRTMDDAIIQTYPLVERVLDASLGVIVHNEHARREVLKRHPQSRVARIPQHFFLPAGFPAQVDVASLRARWGLEDRFVVGSFGLFAPDKRLDVCLRAFSRLLESRPDATYLLCGQAFPGYDLPMMIQTSGLADKVIFTGWMEPVLFAQHMVLLDLAVQLRYPHIGGTPFTPIRLMGLGVPTIISDTAPVAELPEGACAKLLSDEYEEQTLAALLQYLAGHEQVRRQMGEHGRRTIQALHDPDRVAEQVLAFIEQVVALPPDDSGAVMTTRERDLLLQGVGSTLADWGVRETDDSWLLPIAQAIGDLFTLDE